MKKVTIEQRLKQLELEYGGVRSACRALGIDPGYWVRLRSGKKYSPSDCLLQKIGLCRQVYREVYYVSTARLHMGYPGRSKVTEILNDTEQTD